MEKWASVTVVWMEICPTEQCTLWVKNLQRTSLCCNINLTGHFHGPAVCWYFWCPWRAWWLGPSCGGISFSECSLCFQTFAISANLCVPVCDINLSWTQNKGNFLVKELCQRERKLQVSTVSHLMSWSVLREIDWLVSKVARKALKCSLYITLLCMMGINQVCSCT